MSLLTVAGARSGRVTLVMAAMFTAYGVFLPFLARWLEAERDLAGAEIGAVLSAAQLARIITGPLIADWADRTRDRRTPVRVLAAAATLAFAAFFTLAHGFWMLLGFGFIALTLISALMPFIEAATLRACETGRLPYGVARAIGSMSFIFANVVGGFVLARFGAGAVAVWVVAALAMTAILAFTWLLPDPPRRAPRRPGERDQGWRALLKSRRYLLVIIGCGLIQAAHAFYYGFSTLAWRAQGISAETIGLLWACGVAFEVMFLWSLPRIEPRVAPEALIFFGGLGAVLRWTLMGFAPTGWVLWPIQAMHALSFAATHVGAMRLIFRETPESVAGRAQTLYAALATGLFMGVSSLLSGWLYDIAGAKGYWAMAILALAGACISAPLLSQHFRNKA